MTRKEDLLCITGSLYTVGEARDYLLLQGRIMKAFRYSPRLLSLSFSSVSPGSVPGRRLIARKTLGSKKMPEFKMTEEEGPIEIEADRLTYDKEEQLYQAHGNVEI